jgi:hypothetical protein
MKNKVISRGKIEKLGFDGWLDSRVYRPVPFEMVLIKNNRLVLQGWSIGNSWDGLNIEPEKEYRYWRYKKRGKIDDNVES